MTDEAIRLINQALEISNKGMKGNEDWSEIQVLLENALTELKND